MSGAAGPSPEVSTFARDILAIGDACTAVLTQLDATLVAQRRGVLALAAVAGFDAGTVDALADAAPVQEPRPLTPGAATVADPPDDDGRSPAAATAALYHSAAISMSLAFHNAVVSQQMLGVLAQAIVAQGAAKLLASGVPAANATRASEAAPL